MTQEGGCPVFFARQRQRLLFSARAGRTYSCGSTQCAACCSRIRAWLGLCRFCTFCTPRRLFFTRPVFFEVCVTNAQCMFVQRPISCFSPNGALCACGHLQGRLRIAIQTHRSCPRARAEAACDRQPKWLTTSLGQTNRLRKFRPVWNRLCLGTRLPWAPSPQNRRLTPDQILKPGLT